jgi:O-antigen/teichoic acid export membrane protein
MAKGNLNYTKQIFKGTAVILISSILTALLGYFFRVYAARAFTQYEYGLFFSVFALITSIIPLKDLGFGITITRYLPEFIAKKEHQKAKDSLLFLMVLQSVIYVLALIAIVLFSSDIAASYFHDSAAQPILIILAIAFFFSTFHSVFNATNIGYRQVGWYSFFQVAFSAILVIAFHVISIFDTRLMSAAYAYLVAYVLTEAFQLIVFVRTIPDFLKARFDLSLVRELFDFSKYQFFASTIKNLYFNIGTLLLTSISTMESVAFFNIALPTANVIRFITKPFSTMMLSVIPEAKLVKEDIWKKPLSEFYRNTYVIFLPIIAYSLFLASHIIVLLYGEQYLNAAYSFLVLIIGNLFLAAIEVNTNILLGLNRPKQAFLLSTILTGSNIAICFILIPALDFNGAALAFTFSAFLGLLYSLIALDILRTLLGDLLKYMAVTISSVPLFLVYLFTQREDVFTSAIPLAIASVAYVLLIFLLRAVTVEDIRSIRKKLGV